jgi:hypothetical protein
MHSDLPGLSDHGSDCPLLMTAGGLRALKVDRCCPIL